MSNEIPVLYVIDVRCRSDRHPSKVAKIQTFERYPEIVPGLPRWIGTHPGSRQLRPPVTPIHESDQARARYVLRCKLCPPTVTRSTDESRGDLLMHALSRIEEGLRALGHAERGEANLSVLAATLVVLERE